MSSSQIILAEVFLQVDTLKGYRYFDVAGKIMVHYDDQFSDMKVGLEGLQMDNPDSTIRQVQVSAERIWIHFQQPDSLTYVRDQGKKYIETISEFLEVSTFKRIGMRLQYVLGVDGRTNPYYDVQQQLYSSSFLVHGGGSVPVVDWRS